MPESLSRLTALKHMDRQRNHITELPEALRRHAPITYLPGEDRA